MRAIASRKIAELKKSFEFTSEDGKIRSKLEDNVVLYVWYKDELYQMSLRGSSMYSFRGYARKIAVPTVLTHFSSTPQEKGSIEWNQMEFTVLRVVDSNEAQTVIEQQNKIKEAIELERQAYKNMVSDDKVTAAVIDESAALPAGDDDF